MNWKSRRGEEVCNMIGYTNGKGVNASAVFGAGDDVIAFLYNRCAGTLLECLHPILIDNSHCSRHKDDFGVICWNVVELPDVPVRLMMEDQVNSAEGRLEVNIEGEWGSVCDRSYWWDKGDAKVICRMLGFTFGMAVQAGVYGESSGRVWFSDVSCYGNETSIYECQTTIFGGSSECDHAQDVGVFCWDELPVIEVRLLAGVDTDDEVAFGSVEIFFMNQWGAICMDDWGDQDARVICHMLGHSIEHARAGYNITSIITTNRVWMDNVWCDGDEESIMECSFRPFGRHNCAANHVATVKCGL